MSFALMSSAGKDSTLALDRARRQGIDVRYLVNIYDGASGRVAFHGVRQELISAHATALGLEHVSAATTDAQPFEPVLLETLQSLRARGVTGLVFGNIHLTDVRAWYEDRVRDVGLQHVEPLWEGAPADLVREFVERGFRAVVVSVDLEQGAGSLLGKEIDRELIRILEALPNVDACGERGEYHSFVYDGPLFSRPVSFERGAVREERKHRLLDLVAVTHT